ncbi:MAG: CRISPR-associated protein Cas4 [Candidatus Aenigmatarchaeota archaeon]
MYDVYLASEKLGLHTRVDCILIDEAKKQAWPLQVKWAKRPRKLYMNYRAQLMMEALLIEEQIGYTVKSGFIKFLKGGGVVNVDLKDRSLFAFILDEIKNIVRNECLPKPTKFERKCADCCYRRVCWAI